MSQLITKNFDNKDFDIRKRPSGYSRFMDQKVTPDVLSFIADCVLNLPSKNSFTVKSIWTSGYFEKNTKAIFGKPAPSDETAFAEYNKFIGQPLKTLSYSQVLVETKDNNTNRYTINNKNLLEYISLNERGALDFLYTYIVKVLTDSGFYQNYKNYVDQIHKNCNETIFENLKNRFTRFMLGNTEINGKTEINRIFPKVINPLAVIDNLPGVERGRMTKHPFTFSDLMYNRVNFRDLKKDKGVSRQGASGQQSQVKQKEDFAEYRILKAMEIVKRKYSSSEVKDQWALGQATYVHHIFSRSKYPEFAAYTENLIKLTPEQHFNHAHPNAHTQETNWDYTVQCLLSKCNSILQSVADGEFIYSKTRFIHMLNSCLKLSINSETTFKKIEKILSSLYLKA